MDRRPMNDAWLYTLELLEAVSSADDKRWEPFCRPCEKTGNQSTADCGQAPATAHIEIIERRSGALITVCCRDATSGCYGEQCWRLTKARGSGVCVLSGARIRRGDLV
ncbi:DUF3331 domain-containing protein [Paraburkholderia sacchari]|uniref:DUF3331 domain-containing protein n=1 Tax=Paraburkholderia sacchari TaxID=159450 RepID=UPI003D96BC91